MTSGSPVVMKQLNLVNFASLCHARKTLRARQLGSLLDSTDILLLPIAKQLSMAADMQTCFLCLWYKFMMCFPQPWAHFQISLPRVTACLKINELLNYFFAIGSSSYTYEVSKLRSLKKSGFDMGHINLFHPCNRIHRGSGFQIPTSGFRIPSLWIPDSELFGFWIPK